MLTTKQERKIIDHLIYVASIVGPLLTVPQVWVIWTEKSAENVSLITWTTYMILAFLWLLYGLLHKEKPIILVNSLFFIVDTAVVVGAVIY